LASGHIGDNYGDLTLKGQYGVISSHK